MAITRAQQVRQMLEDGGMLVQPSTTGKRPGYRRSNYDASGGGTSKSSKEAGSPGPGRAGSDKQASENRVSAATNLKSIQKAYGVTSKGLTPEEKQARKAGAEQREGTQKSIKDQKGGGLGDFIKGGGFLGNIFKAINTSPLAIKNNLMQRQNYLDYLSRTNPTAFQELAASLVDKNLATADMTEEDDSITSPSQRFGASDFSSKSLSLNEALAGSPDVKDVFGEGYQEYLNRFDPPDRDDGPSQETDPCKGPNPPAYCFIGSNAPKEPEVDPIFYRLLADGGMPEDAPVGGIMDLESGRQMYFLGKLVKKATRAVKKIVKSPLGKAALGAALFKAGGGFKGLAGLKGKLLGVAGSGEFGGTAGLLRDLGLTKGGFGSIGGLTGKGMFGLGALLTSAPLLFGQQEEETEIDPALLGPRLDIASLLANPYQATLGTGFRRTAADGGRIGYSEGSKDVPTFREFVRNSFLDSGQRPKDLEDLDVKRITLFSQAYQDKYGENKADGGIMRIGYQEGSKEPVAKKTMPLLDMGGKEMDLRDNGGFVPIGRMEKADDVPARLSKNEFVFTADAVRNAGDGDVDKGAEVMYNMMKNLEDGGDVSEESQGLEGARNMFQTAQRLEEVL